MARSRITWHLDYDVGMARLSSGATGETSFERPTIVLTLHDKPVEGRVVVDGHGKVDIAPMYSTRYFAPRQRFSNTWRGEVISLIIALKPETTRGFDLPSEFRIFYDSLPTTIGRNVKSAAEHGMLDPLLVDAAVLSVFSRVFELKKAKAFSARSGPINQKELDEFILDRLEASIRVGDLAEYLDVDPVALNAIFKHEFNVSPYHYIQSLRVERSKDLLRNGAMPLSEVAASLGFTDQSHFNRIFRKYTGFTPTAFQKATK